MQFILPALPGVFVFEGKLVTQDVVALGGAEISIIYQTQRAKPLV